MKPEGLPRGGRKLKGRQGRAAKSCAMDWTIRGATSAGTVAARWFVTMADSFESSGADQFVRPCVTWLRETVRRLEHVGEDEGLLMCLVRCN